MNNGSQELAVNPGSEILKQTITELLACRCRERPTAVAYRVLGCDGWADVTFGDHAHKVVQLGQAMQAAGVRRGDRVCILGDVSPAWMVADAATIAIGAITVGAYFTSSPEELDYYIQDSGACLLFVGNATQLAIAASSPQALGLSHIVVLDPDWQATPEDPANACSVAAFLGAPVAAPLAVLTDWAAQSVPSDIVSLGYTSGTTGKPKGVINTHVNLLGGALANLCMMPSAYHQETRIVVHLPLSHIVARVQAACYPLISDSVPHFGRSSVSYEETVRLTRPHYYVAPPRFFQRFAATILNHVNSSPAAERADYRLALSISRRVLKDRQTRPTRNDPFLAELHEACQRRVFAPLLSVVGFDELRTVVTASAPMPADVMTLWQLWGVNLKEAYGQTETVGSNVAQREDWLPAGTIGSPIDDPAWETRVDATGEMIVRGPGVTQGYWNNPEATAEALRDGWLYTGDIVEVQKNGQFKLIDRRKDIIKTINGKTISPTQIENELRGSPYIAEAVVIGEGRKYLTALIEVDPIVGLAWAREIDPTIQAYADICKSVEVKELLWAEVHKANRRLARAEQIKDFTILPEELTPEIGVVTPTRKKKRRAITERYAAFIASMYDEAETELLEKALGKKLARSK
ncbi:AMP-dependent synthetase/ligase [Gemmobacter sp.]|uniref:AMP-dependent synthetase/ligase n=1 Tax=Gemmobacter sp. TaxID=1898957 RepID=UPI002AFE632D|nr:AMP-binding protein [Gemmobacter sp.]